MEKSLQREVAAERRQSTILDWTEAPGDRWVRAGLAIGLVAVPLSFAALLAIRAATPGFSSIREPISGLTEVGSPLAWAANLVFLIYGASMLPLAWAVYKALWDVPNIRLTAVLLGLYGIGVMLVGAFPYRSEEQLAGDITTNALHGAGAWSIFGGLILANATLAWSVRRRPEWQRFVVLSLVMDAIAFPVALIVGLEMWLLPIRGLLQRFVGAVMHLWLWLLLWRAMRGANEPRPEPQVPSGSR
jgi:hypothetical membrane protein